MSNEGDRKSFWATIPGILTALAAIITAITGVWLAIPEPVINSFEAVPDSITEGNSAKLTWSVSNAESVSIAPGKCGTDEFGTCDVSPTNTTTYTITAKKWCKVKSRSIPVQVAPNYAAAWYNKGNAFYDQGKYDDAIQAFNESVRLDPNYAEAWAGKGLALDHLGKTDEAIKAYDEAIRLDPNYAEAWAGKGLALRHQGKYGKAIAALDEAIRLDPNYAEAWAGKGRVIYDQGKYDEAIKCYDEAIRLDPNYAAAWYNKGWALKASGKTTEADAAFAKAKELGYTGRDFL